MTKLQPNSVLVLEDEGLVSLMVEDLLRDMGARVVDVFSAAADALQAATTRSYDCAVLDVIVRDGTSTKVADALHARGIPFVFSTAAGKDILEPRHRKVGVIDKPFEDEVLKAHILSMMRPR